HRALLAVPLLKDDHVVGGLVVRRTEPGEFEAETVSLLQTFALQCVLAIENARLFQELAEKSEELQVASRHKSEFLAKMSHELRTPLNAILSYSQLLEEEAEDIGQDSFIPDLKKIQTAGRHLLELINSILDLSKIEAGKMEVFVEPFDINALVRDVVIVVQPLVERNGNTLAVECPINIGGMQ